MATSTISATGVALTGLITADEYYTYANLSAPSNATQIQAAIYEATEYIMNRLDRWLVSAADGITITEMFNGRGSNSYFPKQGDVLSFGAIEFWNGDEWEAVDQTDYEPETNGDKIFFRSGFTFTKGTKNWRITYTFGLKGGIPRTLKRACAELARYYVSVRADASLRSESDGEQSFSYFQQMAHPDDPAKGTMTDVLDSFRRYYTIG